MNMPPADARLIAIERAMVLLAAQMPLDQSEQWRGSLDTEAERLRRRPANDQHHAAASPFDVAAALDRLCRLMGHAPGDSPLRHQPDWGVLGQITALQVAIGACLRGVTTALAALDGSPGPDMARTMVTALRALQDEPLAEMERARDRSGLEGFQHRMDAIMANLLKAHGPSPT